jgi:fatty-acyl-CoA synthase
MISPYDTGLPKNQANYAALSPLSFLARSAAVYPDRTAIIHGASRYSYAEFYARSRRLASALRNAGIAKNDTVSAMLANTPAMLECHYGVPMAGGVLNTINTRLDAPVIAFILDHAEAKVLITDKEHSGVMKDALALLKGRKPLVVDYDDPEYKTEGDRRAIPNSPGRCRRMNGTQFRSTIHRAPPAIPRASSTITVAPISSRRTMC